MNKKVLKKAVNLALIIFGVVLVLLGWRNHNLIPFSIGLNVVITLILVNVLWFVSKE